ncbi:glycosyltransferase family 2 protein [Marinirhabdus gelatinilytica]|uniref:Glycosyltransferase involved in cell wall biosynthesis n=1 Tax=Marinirhabdus gelatinilytica TaxID=1703343 RepID=A0A370QAT7_9FLAO|nr:glycosyltransferase family 2 protein [Marinirhabdus gelatinilytica]RDK85488.1 glycosyltransferase involved in cell wall biosynthesis [Marinirhabdus gelatinilytica]
MEHTVKISALAITLNEANNMDTFVQGLSFADEIIIVDSFSSDETVAKAKQYSNVTVYEREFDNFSAQKNFAISKAKNDWVVFFDLDEEVTPQLAEEITNSLKDPSAIAYFVKRDFYFMGKKIKYSGLQNDWVIRVFNKGHCQYNKNLVHETLEANGPTAKLKATLPHHTYKSFDDYTAKMHRYSALQAKMLYKKKKKPTLYHFLFRPLYRFWHQFLIRLGILDGKEGFILAYVSAFSVFKRYVNLWLLYRKID